MRDMAEHLGSSAAFLSAIELGKKNIPNTLVDDLVKHYGLDKNTATNLREKAEESAQVVKIRPSSETRELVAQFARRFEELNTKDRSEIMRVLSRKKGDSTDGTA